MTFERWALFGVRSSKLQDLLALTGDTSDGVPGVPGVGPKTASKWLNAFGDLQGVLRQAKIVPMAGEVNAIGGKLRDALVAHEAAALLARELVGFKTDMQLGLTWNALRFETTSATAAWEPSPSI